MSAVSEKPVSSEGEATYKKKGPHLRDSDARVRLLAGDVTSTLSQLNTSTAVGSHLISAARQSEIDLKATQAQSFLNQVTFNQGSLQSQQSLLQLSQNINQPVAFTSNHSSRPISPQQSADLLRTLINGQRRSSTLNPQLPGVALAQANLQRSVAIGKMGAFFNEWVVEPMTDSLAPIAAYPFRISAMATDAICSLHPKIEQGRKTANQVLNKAVDKVTAAVQEASSKPEALVDHMKPMGFSQEQIGNYAKNSVVIAAFALPYGKWSKMFAKIRKGLSVSKKAGEAVASAAWAESALKNSKSWSTFSRREIILPEESGKMVVSCLQRKNDPSALYVFVSKIESAQGGRKPSNAMLNALKSLKELANEMQAKTLFVQPNIFYPMSVTDIRILEIMKGKFVKEGLQQLFIPNPPLKSIFPVFQIGLSGSKVVTRYGQQEAAVLYRGILKKGMFARPEQKAVCAVEHRLMKDLASFSRPVAMPKGFPAHSNQFFAQCSSYNFYFRGIGDNKGFLKGKILFKVINDDAVFFMVNPKSSASSVVRNKVGNVALLQSEGVRWNVRLEYMLKAMQEFSEKNRFKKVYLAWDNQKNPLGVVMANHNVKFDAVGTFSAGVGQKPMSLVEMTVLPKK